MIGDSSLPECKLNLYSEMWTPAKIWHQLPLSFPFPQGFQSVPYLASLISTNPAERQWSLLVQGHFAVLVLVYSPFRSNYFLGCCENQLPVFLKIHWKPSSTQWAWVLTLLCIVNTDHPWWARCPRSDLLTSYYYHISLSLSASNPNSTDGTTPHHHILISPSP